MQRYNYGIIPQSEISWTETILGEGSIGTVYDGTWLTVRIAFKRFNFQRRSERWRRVLDLEVRHLCQLSHQNIVRIYGAVLETGSVGIVMEYLPCSLHRAMFLEGRQFSNAEKKVIIKHVAQGLIFLHDLEIVHCNLTSENVIMSACNYAKIGNYGPKFVRSECATNHCNIGKNIDHRYASPEILHVRPLNRQQLKKCDIYSLGILIYEVFEAKEPYEGLPSDILNHHQTSSSSQVSDAMSPPILDMARNCWGESNGRPTAEQFLVMWMRLM